MRLVNKLFPILFFALLSLVIILPLLPPGFILTIDMVPIPKVSFPAFSSPFFLYGTLLGIINSVIPSYVSQKLILFLIFFLSGWSMYNLVGVKNTLFKLFSGIFYAVNPFVYERVMAGHWNLLLGYALFPFIVWATVNFFRQPNYKSIIFLAALSTLLFSVVVHYTLIFIAFFVIYAAIYLILHQEQFFQTAKPIAVFFLLLILFNANWLLPAFLGTSNLGQNIATFNQQDLVAFQSVEDKTFGLIFNLLSGYGFWGEVYDYYILPKNIVFFWPVISAIFIMTAFLGIIKFVTGEDKSKLALGVTLIFMFLISLDLAGGVALRPFTATVFALYDRFPFLRGFREPQKLIGIVMFVYAYFAGFGLSYLLSKIKKGFKLAVVSSLLLILPFIYTPTIFGGFWGQLKPASYPQSWERIDDVLNQDKENFLVLFFPWHQYMKFNFSNNMVIANPAQQFFDKPVIASQNYETVPLYTHDDRPEALHVDGLLRIEKEGVNLLGDNVAEKPDWGRDLAVVDIKYIILSKDPGWTDYLFLDESPRLTKIFEDETIILYQNLDFALPET